MLRRILTLILSLTAVFLFSNLSANAEYETNANEGESGPAEINDLSDEKEAYAVVTSDGELIFFRSKESYANGTESTFRDIRGSSFTGTVYAGIETLSADDVYQIPWYDSRQSIKRIRVAEGQVIRPVSMAHWFSGFENLRTFDSSGFDTSSVIDMSNLFYLETGEYIPRLSELNLSSFDTSAVTDMSSMFNGQSSLKKLDVSGFDTSRVTSMAGMFDSCSKLESLDVSGFDTSSVTDTSFMFSSCDALKQLDVRNFDVSNVRDGSGMFSGCGSLTELNISGFDTSNMTKMSSFFSGCSQLKELDLSHFDVSGASDLRRLFAGCVSLNLIDLSSFDTSACQNMSGMFADCKSLKTVDLSPLDTSNVQDMGEMFMDSGIEELDLSVIDTSWLGNMYRMFSGCRSLRNINLKGLQTGNVSNMCFLFYDCRSLASLDLSSFDTHRVTDLSCMFYNCRNLETVDLSSFDTSRVKYMYFMFNTCPKLKKLDLSSFDTSNVEFMYRMFYDCASLETLDLGSFDTSRVSDMDNMFTGAYSLKTLKLGKKFTKWEGRYDPYLPAGSWTNRSAGKTLSETEMTAQYPANADKWAGTWERQARIIPVTGINLEDEQVWLFPNENMGYIEAEVQPSNATYRRIIWSNSNPEAAEIEIVADEDFNNYSIEIYARKAGRTTVTASTEDGGYSKSFDIIVGFRDVSNPESYYYEPVYWAYSHEITVGAGGAGRFSPNAVCTREQIVTFLWRLMNTPWPENKVSFTDVAEDSWYEDSISWAAENNITVGLNDGTGRFGIGRPCTREQCVTFLYRAAGEPEVTTHQEFTDVEEGRYYYDAISWAAENGITVGLNDGTGRFGVGQKCTRAMIVTFLYRYAQLTQ
ncbi:MAG: BspA family leucine-rich repeat surface protein [Erysipelotrichaceae bacterium]|nr:BspA family leucine-rich repeat surface protein [Erysipelotrichaceae bacterium]